jgi:ribosomal protein S18 acetylase RimI-like enzyme
MSEIKIRNATIEDAVMLAELSYQTFWDAFHEHPANSPDDMADYMKKAFSVEQIRRELADEKAIFLIAEIDDSLAGYAKLRLENLEEPIKAEKPIELCRLYSTTEFIGKGVGQSLMDECFEIAKQNDCDVMWLGVWEFNPRAQRFYEKQGFYTVGKHIFQLGSDPQTDLLMQKEV